MKCRTFTCIVCPTGCVIETKSEPGKETEVPGNQCKRGTEAVP